MNRVRPYAELLFLAILATGASPEVLPGSEGAPLVQAARVLAPDGPDLGLLNRAIPAEGPPLSGKSADEARRDEGWKGSGKLCGGSTGTLLVGAALLAAVALILAVVIPW